MEGKFINRILTLVLLAILFIIAFIVLKPIFIPITIGLLLAYILKPAHKYIYKKISYNDLSTIILIMFILIIVAVPMWFLAQSLVKQTFDAYRFVQQKDVSGMARDFLSSIFSEEFAANFAVGLSNFITQFFNSLMTEFGKLIISIPNILLQLAIILVVFYFATRDSEKLQKYVSSLSPLPPETEKKFMNEFRHITNAVVFGQVLIGIIQGALLGIMLFILGIPQVLLLTVFAVIVSIIPIIGSWLIWIPIVIILALNGQVTYAIILFLYGAIIVSNIDNILRPILLSKASRLPTAVGFVGIVGGLYALGLVGLVLGPLILAYVLIIIDFYRQGKLSELFKQ